MSHPFDRKEGPDIIYFGGSKVAIRPPQPKRPEVVNIAPRSKEQEIENLKRLLANISQRLDALKHR